MSEGERLDEEMDDAATGESDSESLIIGISERHEPRRVVAVQHRERFGDDRAFGCIHLGT